MNRKINYWVEIQYFRKISMEQFPRTVISSFLNPPLPNPLATKWTQTSCTPRRTNYRLSLAPKNLIKVQCAMALTYLHKNEICNRVFIKWISLESMFLSKLMVCTYRDITEVELTILLIVLNYRQSPGYSQMCFRKVKTGSICFDFIKKIFQNYITCKIQPLKDRR